MSEMRECPFCGNDVNHDEGCFPTDPAGTRWEVRCGNPNCYAGDPGDTTRQAAIDRWNRRTDDRWELTEAGRAMRGGR